MNLLQDFITNTVNALKHCSMPASESLCEIAMLSLSLSTFCRLATEDDKEGRWLVQGHMGSALPWGRSLNFSEIFGALEH